MQKRVLFYALGCLVSFNVLGQYTYEANQDLYDLNANANNFNGELAYEVSDDGISPAIDLSFNFTFYGSTFSQARMATNGCLHFGNSGSYCNDYTPDPINGQHTYTIYPFWTDLIRDNDSRMKSWGDSSKMIFGWYNLREYNRASDNSFEIILWNNNSFDLRYRELDIINHDVLIGEVGANKDNSYTYYYHDECNTGSTNSSSCYNYDWNSSDKNTNLENGGSLYGSGSGNSIDCSDPLNDTSCSGYADAYQTQQCNIDQLYSESCPYYWDAYDDQQCADDPQYAPFCQGYQQEESVAFFDDTNVDYGYVDEQEQFATGVFEDDYHDDYGFEEQFTVVEVYEDEMFPSYEEFGGDNLEEYFNGSEPEELIIFFEPDPLPFIDDFTSPYNEPFQQEEVLLDEFIFQETFLVEDYSEPETFIEFNSVEELEEWFEEETNEHFEERIEEELANLDEPEEEFIEEIFEEEVVEEVFEAIEERIAEAEIEEERIEREEVVEEFEEVFQEEFEIAERENTKGESSISREIALRVVSSTIATATQSVSGTNAGNSVHSTGNTAASGNAVGNSSTGASSGNAGISTSSSPSMSDQFASATVQTNQVLDMSSMSVSSSSTSDSINTTDVNTSVVVANVNTNTVQDQIDTSISSMSTSSDTDTTVEDVIAQNLQTAQEEVEAQQEETGEYGSEDTIIAYMGFVPGFNTYEKVLMVDQDQWYTSRTIYTETMPDNINAFYGLAGSNISKMNDIINSQPPL
jgi:hypothetical protein